MKAILICLATAVLSLSYAGAQKKSPSDSKKPPSSKKVPAKPSTKKPSGAAHLTPATEKVKASAKREVAKLSSAQKTKLLGTLNKGTPAQLKELPGIGADRAANIKKARPYKTVDQLVNVTGIGEKTFKDIIAQTKNPSKKKPSTSPKSSTTKKPTTPSTKKPTKPSKSSTTKKPSTPSKKPSTTKKSSGTKK